MMSIVGGIILREFYVALQGRQWKNGQTMLHSTRRCASVEGRVGDRRLPAFLY
jgi:hypothetical protein